VRSKALGFRCCAGPANKAEVVLHVERHAPLEQRNLDADPSLLDDPSRLLPDEARAELKHPDTFRVSRVWAWHPVGNEELIVLGGCTPEVPHQACGVVVVRRGHAGRQSLLWASSARYLPTLRVDRDPRYLWVYGGDDRSHFRRLVEYDHGRVMLGTTQRNMKTTSRGKGPSRAKP
jgi:hypothetical protein